MRCVVFLRLVPIRRRPGPAVRGDCSNSAPAGQEFFLLDQDHHLAGARDSPPAFTASSRRQQIVE
jgi:hypothetical protein